MQVQFSGLDAVVLAARDIGAEVITYVPGYPITELAEALRAEITLNEKVALEIALGASATGSRSIVVVKQVGMNILADPLVISATHTIGSGLVVIAGDDLGPKGSQTEMDSRFYGPLAKLPVLDPRDPVSLYKSTGEAFILSERLRIPVIIRITQRVLLSSFRGDSSLSQGDSLGTISLRASTQIKDTSCLDFDETAWDLTSKGRQKKHRMEILPLAQQASEDTSLNWVQTHGDVGIIASGYPAKIAEDIKESLLAVGYAYPLPWKQIRRFIEDHSFILIAEEPEPFIESQLGRISKIKGKLTGHLPYGLMERSDLMNALENLRSEPDIELHSYESAEERGFSGICEDCPFSPFYRALAGIDASVAGDAGCAIRATRRPCRSVDVVYGLGSSIGVASGFRKKGVAVIGDFAFAHTGISGLLNAIWKRRDVLVVMLKNGMAATTGGQEAPDLTYLLKSLMPTKLVDFPISEGEIEEILKEELAKPGSSSIVLVGECPRKS